LASLRAIPNRIHEIQPWCLGKLLRGQRIRRPRFSGVNYRGGSDVDQLTISFSIGRGSTYDVKLFDRKGHRTINRPELNINFGNLTRGSWVTNQFRASLGSNQSDKTTGVTFD
ncbi:hypothetical protein L0F63_003434, partial [Massospora cicadina]